MRKVFKIVLRVFSTVLALLIALPLVLSLLLQIPAVQNFVVHKAAQAASRKLETTVSIGHVRIGLLGKVQIQDFYVEDYQKDTLLYVGNLDAYIRGLGIFGGGIVIDRGELTDAKLYLRETPSGEMNIKQVVARLSNPDKTPSGNFQLSLTRASVKNMDFCLERLDHRDPEHGIDFSHMHLYNVMAYIDDFTIDGAAIYTTIQSFAARERSGFELNHLSGRFYLTGGCLGFEQASIITPQSNVSIPYISLVGESWAVYKDFIGEVRLDAAIRNSVVSTDDVSYFSPKLRDWHVVFSNINVEISGEVDDLHGKIKSLQIGDATHLTADATVKGLPDIQKTYFDLSIPHLSSTAVDADRLARSITGHPLPASVTRILKNTGTIDLTSSFRGLLSSFDLKLGIATHVGQVSCNVQMTPQAGGLQRVKGDVATRNLRLGELLGRRDLLGNATLTARVDGVVGRGYADANVVGNVEKFGFNGYVYDSLRLDGRLRNKEFNGKVTARDPNLRFDFAGLVNFNDQVPQYDFSMELQRADLVKLKVNHRDSISELSGRLVAKGSGRSLDDMNGLVQVTDVVYRYNDKQITADNMTITGENSPGSKFVELHSDFADATFRSRMSYRDVFEYLRQSAWKYLPLISRGPTTESASQDQTAVADDYSLLSIDIRKFNPVADAVSPGLQVADGSSMQLLFNPSNNRLSFRASSEYIERKRLLATRLNINASNRGDSLTFYASAEDLYAGALHLPHLSVTGGAKQGLMQVSAGFNDTIRKFSGLFGLRAGVLDENGPDGRVVDLRILPSHITRGNTTWQIFARRILADTARVVIDKFYVMNSGQELLLDGTASRSRDDSLTLRLKNFDLSPFSQIADRMGYSVEGRTSGEATMKSVLRGGEITADILVDSLAVNGLGAPPLRLSSRWDIAQNRAGLAVINRIKRDTLIRGFYAPDQVRYYARLAVDSLELGLLDPILSGVISDTQGVASADLVLQGQHRAADLSGRIRISGFKTKVAYTQVSYSMPSAVLEVKDSRFRTTNATLYDEQGNQGRFDFDMNLHYLSNITYDIRVAPQKLLVLNTTERDNDVFYGKVYATGMARISGDKAGVNMDISATTDDHSSFSLPLSSKANISAADFVTFVEPVVVDSVDNLASKKLLFERKHKQKSSGGGQMNISLALDVRPNVDLMLSVADNTIRARGEGSLNMRINPRLNIFDMYGDYTITEGSFLFSSLKLITKKFVIEPGSTILWTGSPMNALLNIETIYKVKASLQPLLQGTSDRLAADRSVPVDCVIKLTDRLSKPTILFDVRVPSADPETQTVLANALNTPESVDMQFLYLLVTSSFKAESAAAGANLGASVSAATGLEFLANQLSSMLSNNEYNIILRYRPSSDVTSDEVDFGLSKSLINNRLFVEAEGNYLIDKKQAVTNNTSNFMGEAYITYLIDRSGSLRLKAFTQTIDRFDENQGLQETGIGIYYKEDFNNFRDLRHRVKERFTNKTRQARRAARKLEKEQQRQAADTLLSPRAEEQKREKLK